MLQKKNSLQQKKTVLINSDDAWKYDNIPSTHQGVVLDPVEITPDMIAQAAEQVKIANNSVISKLAKKRKKKSDRILAAKKGRKFKKKGIKKPRNDKSIYLRQELERYRNMYV